MAPVLLLRRRLLLPLALVIAAASDCKAEHSCGGDASLVCQSYQPDCRSGLNEQIARELAASHVYLAMAAHFEHDVMAKPGFAKFFYKASAEEREHALKLIKYHNKRGGRVTVPIIQAPQQTEWASGLAAMRAALQLEKEINAHLLRLHNDCRDDPATTNFLDNDFLDEQIESIKQLGDYVRQLKNLHETNAGLGEHIFDKDLN